MVYSMIEDLSLEQFLAHFPSEKTCADYLLQCKWPNGFVCPRCGHRHAYQTSTRRLPLFECAHCRHQTSLTVGTVMEGTHTPLRKWFTAFFLVSQTSNGINALQLSRIIEVTYKTAWLLLHKIRQAMSESVDSVLLSGFIHVNAACYGRPYNPTLQKHPKEHPLLVGASMNAEDEPVYVKMKQLPHAPLQQKYVPRAWTEAFTRHHVEPDPSHVEFVTERFKSPKLKKLISIFVETNRWINSTFHGLGGRHLQGYLNEFCYRFKSKKAEHSYL
jgi:transposase-like protein